MEANIQSKSNKHEPLVYSCDKCEKEFKRRSSLTRHIHSNHEPIDVTLCKVKPKNENLLLQIDMYNDKIKLLKKLILIHEHNMRVNERSNIQRIGVLYLTLPEIQYGSGELA